MKIGFFLSISLILILFALACQTSITSSGNNEKADAAMIQTEKSVDNKKQDTGVWIPDAIEKCVAKANTEEPLEIAAFINPFYLRADFDSNGLVDYAILVQGQSTKKRGVVICKDSKETFIFGAITKPKTPLTSFEDDNFITENWEIATKEESKNIFDSPGHKIATGAKGESVAFVFEGGSVIYIFWDGKTFRIVEGV